MPLAERLIDQRFCYAEAKYLGDGGAKCPSLHDVQMASLYGTIVQLGHLSRFAHQLLDDLLQEANKQQSRLNSVGSRVKALGTRLMDDTATSKSTTAASDEMRPAQDAGPVSGFFTKPDQPGAIRDRYTSASVGRVPDFSRIDTLVAAAPRPSALEEESSTNSRELCAVLYSNPEFFFKEWLRAETERLKKLEEEKKARRAERRARRQQLQAVRASQKQQTAVNVKGLDWRKKYEAYNSGTVGHGPVGRGAAQAEVRDLVQRQQRSQPPSTSKGDGQARVQQQLQHAPPPPPLPQPLTVRQQAEATPPPAAPSPRPLRAAEAPLQHQGPASVSTPESRAPAQTIRESGVEAAPDRPPMSRNLLADITAGAPRLRPAVPAVDVDEGPEGSTGRGRGAGGDGVASRPPAMRSDLLSSIAAGAKLRPATSDSPPPASSPQNSASSAKLSMLQEIKLNKTKLKHVDQAPAPGPAAQRTPVPRLAQEVQDILARRKFLQAESDSESDEEGWED